MTIEDPFPRERVAAVLRRLPAYLRLAWRLAREPLLSRARRAAVIGAAGYLASPVDLVPGIIPVVGQLDDIAVALAAIRFALAGLTPERRREHLDAVGLGDQDVAADLRTVGATSAWLLRAGARTTVRAAKVGGRAAVAGAGIAVRGSKAMAKGAIGAARSASDKARSASDTARSASGAARSAAGSSRAAVAGTAVAGAAGRRLAGLRRKGGSPETLDVEKEGSPPSAVPPAVPPADA